jgi:hypothetical protein
MSRLDNTVENVSEAAWCLAGPGHRLLQHSGRDRRRRDRAAAAGRVMTGRRPGSRQTARSHPLAADALLAAMVIALVVDAATAGGQGSRMVLAVFAALAVAVAWRSRQPEAAGQR